MEYDVGDIQYHQLRMTERADFAKIAPMPRGIALARQLHTASG
jgi:hypothetical protein